MNVKGRDQKLTLFIHWVYQGKEFCLKRPVFKDEAYLQSKMPLKTILLLGICHCIMELQDNPKLNKYVDNKTNIKFSIYDFETKERYNQEGSIKFNLIKDDDEINKLAEILSDDWEICRKTLKQKKIYKETLKWYDNEIKLLYIDDDLEVY